MMSNIVSVRVTDVALPPMMPPIGPQPTVQVPNAPPGTLAFAVGTPWSGPGLYQTIGAPWAFALNETIQEQYMADAANGAFGIATAPQAPPSSSGGSSNSVMITGAPIFHNAQGAAYNVTGVGFTANSAVTIFGTGIGGTNKTNLGDTTSDASGNINASLVYSGTFGGGTAFEKLIFMMPTGVMTLYASDNATGIQSNKLTITIQ